MQIFRLKDACIFMLCSFAGGVAIGASAPAPKSLQSRLGPIADLCRFAPHRALTMLTPLERESEAAPPSVRIQYLFELSSARRGAGNLPGALSAADELIAIATISHVPSGIAQGLLAKALALPGASNMTERQKLLNEAERLAVRGQDTPLRVEALVAAGEAFAENGNFPGALDRLTAAATLARSNGAPRGELLALNAMAKLYGQIKEHKKGFETLTEAYAIGATGTYPGYIAQLKNTEYGLAIDMGQRKRAQAALLSGLELENAIGAQRMVAVTLINLSDSYLKDSNNRRAADLASKALSAANELNDLHLQAVAQFNLAQAQLGLGEAALGKRNAMHALQVVAKASDLPSLQMAWAEYGAALEKAGDPRSALDAYHRERELSNALFHKQRQEAIWKLEARYDGEKKAREIERLNQENALKSAQIENGRLQTRLWVLLVSAVTLMAVVTGVSHRKVRQANARLQITNVELAQQGARDPLTSLYNRRHFQQFMARRSASGEAGSGAFFLLDLDNFKQINDQYGHGIGDLALTSVAATLRETLRETDMIVRWGGEEFLAFLPYTHSAQLEEVAGRLLRAISQRPVIESQTAVAISVSIGFAPLSFALAAPISWERVVHLVDMALYLAKRRGKNRAYGIRHIPNTDNVTLTSIEEGLERAWEAGAIEMSIVLGCDQCDPARCA